MSLRNDKFLIQNIPGILRANPDQSCRYVVNNMALHIILGLNVTVEIRYMKIAVNIIIEFYHRLKNPRARLCIIAGLDSQFAAFNAIGVIIRRRIHGQHKSHETKCDQYDRNRRHEAVIARMPEVSHHLS